MRRTRSGCATGPRGFTAPRRPAATARGKPSARGSNPAAFPASPTQRSESDARDMHQVGAPAVDRGESAAGDFSASSEECRSGRRSAFLARLPGTGGRHFALRLVLLPLLLGDLSLSLLELVVRLGHVRLPWLVSVRPYHCANLARDVEEAVSLGTRVVAMSARPEP